jgi:hypothetical protein
LAYTLLYVIKGELPWEEAARDKETGTRRSPMTRVAQLKRNLLEHLRDEDRALFVDRFLRYTRSELATKQLDYQSWYDAANSELNRLPSIPDSEEAVDEDSDVEDWGDLTVCPAVLVGQLVAVQLLISTSIKGIAVVDPDHDDLVDDPGTAGAVLPALVLYTRRIDTRGCFLSLLPLSMEPKTGQHPAVIRWSDIQDTEAEQVPGSGSTRSWPDLYPDAYPYDFLVFVPSAMVCHAAYTLPSIALTAYLQLPTVRSRPLVARDVVDELDAYYRDPELEYDPLSPDDIVGWDQMRQRTQCVPCPSVRDIDPDILHAVSDRAGGWALFDDCVRIERQRAQDNNDPWAEDGGDSGINTEETEMFKHFEGDLGIAIETLDALVPNIGHIETDPTYWGEDDVE